MSAAAVWFFCAQGSIFNFGDAEAHWNIARQITDSQTAGYDQIGTVWLPLPHLMLLPLARVDAWWRNGMAAALPSAISFVIAGAFLFAAIRRLINSVAAAVSTALFAGNPNLLYLQSTPMAEAVFFACLLATLYFTVRFRQEPGWGSVAGAGIACCLGTLTRYEGWFLIPFVAVYLAFGAKRHRLAVAAVFCLLASLGPLYWFAHNWWLSGDSLEFYRGPYSAQAIQGASPYPGRGDWKLAALYFRTAAELCAGPGLWWMGMAGVAAALIKRAIWPVLLLALPGIFYIWAMHSTATPIFVPTLWPNTYYNTRYGLAALPLLAAASGVWVALAPRRARVPIAILGVVAGIFFWVLHPRPGQWVVWKEASVNSEARRAWIAEARSFLAPQYLPGEGVFSSSGEFRAVFRESGIPLRESMSVTNGLPWMATLARPELLLWQDWALIMGGDAGEACLRHAAQLGVRYRLEKSIMVKNGPAIEIYRRAGGRHGSS